MKKEEIVERIMSKDVRVFNEIQKIKQTDTSFTEKGLLGIPPRYSQKDVREIYFNAIRLGLIRGIEIGSPTGQNIELHDNANEKQKEFLDKLYELEKEYNCGIRYNPNLGMQVFNLE
jgi:hypothetical protein